MDSNYSRYSRSENTRHSARWTQRRGQLYRLEPDGQIIQNILYLAGHIKMLVMHEMMAQGLIRESYRFYEVWPRFHRGYLDARIKVRRTPSIENGWQHNDLKCESSQKDSWQLHTNTNKAKNSSLNRLIIATTATANGPSG